MQDENYDVTSLEPQSRSVARVLLVLADAPVTAIPESPDTLGTGDVNGSNGHYDITAGELEDIQLGGSDELAHDIPADDSDTAPGISTQAAVEAGISHPVYLLLAPGGHQITWTTRHDWHFDISAAHGERKFDVIVIEAEAPPSTKTTGKSVADAVVETCMELRKSPLGRYASILAVVPAARKGDRGEKHRKMAQSLLHAGADDLFPANATAIEVESRVAAMTRLARLRAELEEARDQLRSQLQTDDLTKLLNRRFFFQAAHRECGRARRYNSELSCLMVEIDHFKKLCTTLGWDCGDLMLRALAQILRDYTRDSDIVARFADEKFVVLLPETSLDGATMLREKIQAAVEDQPLTWRGHPVPLSISVGEANRLDSVAHLDTIDVPQVAEDFESTDSADGIPLSTREELAELLKAADAALFVAKRGVRLPILHAGHTQHTPSDPNSDSDLPSLSKDLN